MEDQKTDQSADQNETPNTPPVPPTESVTPEATASEPTATAPSHSRNIIIGIVLLLIIGGGYYWWSTQMDGGAGDAAAVVNGAAISLSDYNENLDINTERAIAQGANPYDLVVETQIKEQAIGALINTELLIQAATAANVTISDEEVAEQRGVIETQMGGADALTTELGRLSMSEAELLADIREQLLIDSYLVSETDDQLSVTEEDIAAFYNEIVAAGQELPPLEEIAAQLEQQLTNQQRLEAVQAIIDRLKSEAEIEILI